MPKYGNNFMFLLFGELSTQNLLWYPKLMRKQFHFRNLYKDRARMYVKTYVRVYLSQCLCSQKTGYQSKCWAIEDQLNKSHFVHATITSLKRTGEIYTYWHMDWSPTYIVTNKKHGAQAWMADWFQLSILIRSPPFSVPSLALGDQPLWIASLGS